MRGSDCGGDVVRRKIFWQVVVHAKSHVMKLNFKHVIESLKFEAIGQKVSSVWHFETNTKQHSGSHSFQAVAHLFRAWRCHASRSSLTEHLEDFPCVYGEHTAVRE